MAKEMIIIFVYDTQLIQREEDDPATAILYFHPSWVSDEQKTALCGQIMGTTLFMKSTFSMPKIISLQSGKFALREYGRYTLVVGTDRNITDWVLEYRIDTLESLVTFYHHDLEALATIYRTYDGYSAKLYHIFETYLKILLYSASIFANIPTIQLPKSGSNVFLESLQILQSCQEIEHVLGGIMLSHNKVLATQLSNNITRRIVLTDPYRIKSPAEIADVGFQLPNGVQLLQIYVEGEDYGKLLEESNKCRAVNRSRNKKDIPNKISQKPIPTKEPVLSAMKRDQSIIFSTVPEEDSEHTMSSPQPPLPPPPTKKPRPKFLNLKSKTIDSGGGGGGGETSTFTSAVTTTDQPVPAPSTPFHGQTSICSTPMTDLNKVLHSTAMSICLNPDEPILENNDSGKTNSINSILSAVSEHSHTSLHSKMKLLETKCYYTFDSSKIARFNRQFSRSSWNLTEVVAARKRSLSVSDPTFPAVKTDGSVISATLYQQYLQCETSLIHLKLDSDLSIKNTDKTVEENHNKEIITTTTNTNKESISAISKPEIANNGSKEQRRKSLNLPLKSLSFDTKELPKSSYSTGVLLTPLMSKLSILAGDERSSGFCSRDTTPSEYNDYKFNPGGFNNGTTAGKDRDEGGNGKVATVATVAASKNWAKCGLQRAVLFVCGQQDMVVGVIVEEEGVKSQESINKLHDICIQYLGRLAKQLLHCLETHPGTTNTVGGGATTSGSRHHNQHRSGGGDTEPYSFLAVDSSTYTVTRGGPWGGAELGALTHLHKDFRDDRQLTEIILRDDDSVIYGYHNADTEVYYHETATSSAGLPPPADLMGVAPLKAKRRLERDQGIILL